MAGANTRVGNDGSAGSRSGRAIQIANKLLQHRAHIDWTNRNGATPLIIAALTLNKEMYRFLFSKDANEEYMKVCENDMLLLQARLSSFKISVKTL